jgi:hypothetical protein
MSEAHISVLVSRLFRLLAASLLPGPQIGFPAPNLEYDQIGRQRRYSFRTGFRTIRLLGPASPAQRATVPFLPGIMPCVLGAQCLGDVLIHGPHLDSAYV